MPLKFRISALLVLLFLAWLLSYPAASAQSSSAYIVTALDKTQFPTVQLKFRAIDLQTTQLLANLNNTTVTVYENGSPVSNPQVTRRADDPINIVFLLDLGATSNYSDFGLSNLREAILALVQGGYFVDGKDTVQVLGRENINSDQTVPLLNPTQKGSDLVNWANQFDFLSRSRASLHPTKGLQGVAEAMDAADRLVSPPGSQTSAVILISHAIEDPVIASAEKIAANLSVEARQRLMSIYAIQTLMDINDKKFNSPLMTLATGSVNGYTALYSGKKPGAVDAVYQVINNQRTAYTVTYQSQVQSAGPVQVTINSPKPGSADLPGAYEVSGGEISSTAPSVAIVQPADGSTIRIDSRYAADGQTVIADLQPVTVVAEISWAQNVAHHPFLSAELWVNGKALAARGEWNSDLTRLTFSWDPAGLTQTQLQIPLSVRLVDENGKAIQGDSTLSIVISPPPPNPCPEGSLFCGPGLNWLVGVSVALLFLLAVVVAVFLLQRRPLKKGPSRKPAKDILASKSSGEPIGLATLNVLEGPEDMKGKKIELTKTVTVLGRNPEEADIVFYPNAKSSVSRVHCTIKVEGRRYVLSDNQSSNGTWVNGQRLYKDEAIPLQNGDVITLGDMIRGGVKVRLHLQSRRTSAEDED